MAETNQATVNEAYRVLGEATDPGHVKAIADSLERNTTGELREKITALTRSETIIHEEVGSLRDKLRTVIGDYITVSPTVADAVQMEDNQAPSEDTIAPQS